MNLLLAIIAITGLSLVISLVSDVRKGLGITNISVVLLLSAALLVGISIMAGPSKLQDAAPMARGTPVVLSMAPLGELLRRSGTRSLLLTRLTLSLDLVSRALVGNASGSVVVALGVEGSDHEWIHTPCRKSCFGRLARDEDRRTP